VKLTSRIQPSEQAPLPPTQALEEARQELLEVFRKGFEKASAARDAAATSRFFKLFPAIGWEAEGLEAYAAFVVDLVRVRPPPAAKSGCVRQMYLLSSLLT
jgi:conserved oligomeric Golgi complex subunit 4